MLPPLDNTRYILELERNRLLQEQEEFDQKYGTFSFAFLASLENLALVAYLYIAAVLLVYKKNRTKTNLVVSIWAIVNAIVLTQKILQLFEKYFETSRFSAEEVVHPLLMIAALGRSYGTSLAIVWLYSKLCDTPKPKYNFFLYLLILMPTLICVYFIFYYFNVNKYVFEVYPPGCDIVDVVVYIGVAVIFILSKIFVNTNEGISQLALLISLVNLVTNFPIGLISIYTKFNLDISWTYRFHIYFVDVLINIITCSNAFIVLYLIITYNKKRSYSVTTKKYTDDDDDDDEDKCC